MQIKNPIYRSEINHKEIYIRQMAEIMGQSDPKQTPWNTRSYRRVADRPQKYQKRRSNTCQITHSHLLKGEDAPVCPTCKVQLTTKHILLNCNNLKHIRTKYYQGRKPRDIFKNTNPENIFNFLKKQLFQQDITKHLYRTATLMTEIQNNLFGIKWPTGVDMP